MMIESEVESLVMRVSKQNVRKMEYEWVYSDIFDFSTSSLNNVTETAASNSHRQTSNLKCQSVEQKAIYNYNNNSNK